MTATPLSQAYSAISTVFAPLKDKGKRFSVYASWLPLVDINNSDALALLNQHYTPYVFACLDEPSFTAMAAAIELYALENKLFAQSQKLILTPFDKTANVNNANSGELDEQTAVDLAQFNENGKSNIDCSCPLESIQVISLINRLCLHALQRQGIPISKELDNTKLRKRANELLTHYPFLSYVIFALLPRLSLLRYQGEVLGLSVKIVYLRGTPSELSIDDDWQIKPDQANIVID